MRSIAEFLGEAQAEFPDELEGNQTHGGYDGPPLAQDRQYRAEVSRAEWRQANESGKWSYSITFKITEDPGEEFVGRLFSEYFSIDEDAHRVAKEKFARFIGESGVVVSDTDQSDNAAFIQSFEGISFVIATRVWGQDDDRTGIRYLNRDRGQALQASIAPPKKSGGTRRPLKADIAVNKGKGPFPAQTASDAEEAGIADPAPVEPPVTLPGAGTAPPVNLPPGLQPRK